ncbi:hypothetical protein ACFPT7_22310 [Acidicapsa dinghuensis]|uniref:HprK-related kinase B n=1 Tax=Acidicapsa dinghuensis TaxID=2218256 RepID=A0ABW1EM26_9BACT|nr:hypothetical protein [Acidicapsa dinghuensis]
MHVVEECSIAVYDVEGVACACPRQWLYLLGEGGVVYSELQNRFAGLNPAGVSAYRAFEAGASLEDLRTIPDADHFTSTSGEELQTVYKLSQGTFPDEDASPEWPTLNLSSCGDPANVTIEIDGNPISLRYPPGRLARLCLDYFRGCPITNRQPRCYLSAQQTGNGWAIYVNDCEFLVLQRKQQLGLGLMHAARSFLNVQGDYDVAFHAAMAAQEDRGILLCAARECGKSTLAAHLVAQGFDLLTDEPALLDLDTWSVKSLSVPISLKQGSWPVLQRQWPDLASAPVHIRSDGTKIRLAHPSKERCSSRARRLTQIVFPHYCPGSKARVESMSPFQTLRCLIDGGMLLHRRVARDGFEKFLRLISLTPAYEIHYPSLQEADRMLREAI